MRHIRVVSAVLIFVLIMCLSACTGDTEKKPYIGTWETISPSVNRVTVTFKEDSTFEWMRRYSFGAVTTYGKYETDEKGTHITMHPEGDDEDEWAFNYVADGDCMTFYRMYSAEPEYTFNRQK